MKEVKKISRLEIQKVFNCSQFIPSRLNLFIRAFKEKDVFRSIMRIYSLENSFMIHSN